MMAENVLEPLFDAFKKTGSSGDAVPARRCNYGVARILESCSPSCGGKVICAGSSNHLRREAPG